MPQKRLTAVGRVAARWAHISATSALSSGMVLAVLRSMPMATPIAPETPMAIAPRMIMSRMTVATCL